MSGPACQAACRLADALRAWTVDADPGERTPEVLMIVVARSGIRLVRLALTARQDGDLAALLAGGAISATRHAAGLAGWLAPWRARSGQPAVAWMVLADLDLAGHITAVPLSAPGADDLADTLDLHRCIRAVENEVIAQAPYLPGSRVRVRTGLRTAAAGQTGTVSRVQMMPSPSLTADPDYAVTVHLDHDDQPQTFTCADLEPLGVRPE